MFLDFEPKQIRMPTIIGTEIIQFENYERKIEIENGEKQFYICGINFDKNGVYYKSNDISVLYDILKFGEYIYTNFSKDRKHNPIFKKTDEEGIILSEKIVTICKKYGMPNGKTNKLKIYDFAFLCYDLYCRFSAWLSIAEMADDLEQANEMLGTNYNTVKEIKQHIVPTEVWDYEQDSITLTFNYNKENDIYEFVYYCHKLIDIAFLQFNFLFLSEEGLMDYNGRNVKIKLCSICHEQFATFDGKQKICSKHSQEEKNRLRKQKSRMKNKSNDTN